MSAAAVVSADVAFDLAQLVEEHGITAVMAALRDACRAAADFRAGQGDEDGWRGIGDRLDVARHDIEEAEARDIVDGVTIGMALTVLADTEAA